MNHSVKVRPGIVLTRFFCAVLAFGFAVGAACFPAAGQVAGGATVKPPLHTEGYSIVDSTGKRVRLTSVNWFGFDEKEYVPGGLDHAPLAAIVAQIQAIGVNSVRLPWANETLEHDPVVADYALKANPELKGKHAMQVMDAVIAALAKARIMVILDNHMSNADWCCDEKDKNGLWYNEEYPETKWLADWRTIVLRYKNQPWVVGADLRNELRNGTAWGGNDAKLDWHAAAERGGDAVLKANNKLLIMVESPDYSTNFAGFDTLPVRLKVDHRLVYSPHAYSFSGKTPLGSYDELKQAYEARAGFLLHSKPEVPLWIGEFGTCQTLDCGESSAWFGMFIRYLKENDLSWSYWPLNGTQSSGRSRTFDSVETYGLLTPDYRHIAATKLVEMLKTVEAPEKR